MPTYTNKGAWAHNTHTVKAGRTNYLGDGTARPATAKALTTRRHHVRTGRSSYVNDVFGKRKS